MLRTVYWFTVRVVVGFRVVVWVGLMFRGRV